MSHPTSDPRRYPYPILALISPVLRILFGIPSSLSRDAAILVKNIRPAPRVLGADNIPTEMPFVLALNHYDSPGLGAWWGAAVMVCAIAAQRTHAPRDLRLLMAREWWYPPGLGRA